MLSVFDLFKVGIGPSSSHTMGPMRAIREFLEACPASSISKTHKLIIHLYGSLALTGRGHGIRRALVLGAMGYHADAIDPQWAFEQVAEVKSSSSLKLLNVHLVDFDFDHDVLFHRRHRLDYHANGMRFELLDSQGSILRTDQYYSLGGGFVMSESQRSSVLIAHECARPPYYYKTATGLKTQCDIHNIGLIDLLVANETMVDDGATLYQKLNDIWQVMSRCIDRGIETPGILPGGLQVKRRAFDLFKKLDQDPNSRGHDPLNWVSLFALAVNEENAAGSVVVTAPTNGAAGIIPAVIRYYLEFVPKACVDKVPEFLLVSGAIGGLFKEGASISAAEVGCQGEVGVACAMAAAGLCHVLGGNLDQVLNAAEMGMEHNLGLTCDPIAGLVQIPCIERNALGAAKAISAAKLALAGDGDCCVSLDKVIATMIQTGRDMTHRYKETSTGGLAVNLVEC